ncbi:hypothetical protein BDY19DRAFT_964078 [Irpex rosettiformis]|uniref:Uncharacterized protein n=1 Tax=Irpex rosettiformis TaxID=378272 RepID=A0ACB8TUJ8_9APHY|nr:hypothetical protein BDY19DRAFT_964078 [Irpex rosettiformis]
MQEDQDTCRICSGPAEPDQPLFYPCKCSGTIRYIHQECLTTWLAHSKKKTCDVCKHPYSFQKVYAQDMPPRLPLFLLVKRFAQQSFVAILFGIRIVIVGLIWCAVLPWATIWTWRMYFAMGDSTAWWISNRERPRVDTPADTLTTYEQQNDTSPDATPFETFLTHPSIRTISADIVAGQIIATIIVVAFVAIFLLREWITQNARPGVFDEADAPPEAAIQVVAEPVIPLAPAPAPLPPPAQDTQQRLPIHEFPQPQLPVVPADAMRDAFPNPNEFRFARRAWPRADSDTEEEKNVDLDYEDKGKRPLRPSTSNSDIGTSSGVKRRHSWSYEWTPDSNRATPPVLNSEQNELTVNLEEHTSVTDVKTETVPVDWKMDFSSWNPLSGSSQAQNTADIKKEEEVPLPPTPGKPHGRPPLFSTALFAPAESGSQPQIFPQTSHGNTPLASPSLATYRAPEEFEAGPSNIGYFPDDRAEVLFKDEDAQTNELDEEEWETYFREPSSEERAQIIREEEALAPQDIEQGEEEEDRALDADPDAEMPALQHWTDDEDFEEDEDEDGADVVVELEAPAPEPLVEDEELGQVQEDAVAAANGGDVDDVDLNMEFEGGMEDDMEDILAAIGLRGPIYGVLQNAALMIFVLDTTIGIGVWLPFTIGKSLALLSLEPRRLLHLIDFPIRAIRIITDPVVDTFMLFLSQAIYPPFKHVALLLLRPVSRFIVRVIGEKLTQDIVSNAISLYEHALGQFTSSAIEVAPSATFLEKLAAYDSPVMQYAEPYFAPLGENLRTLWQEVQEHWIKLALGNGTSEKIFAISLGYVVDALLLAIYLNVLTIGSMKSAGRAVRSAIRQQLLVVKVAAFILVELVVFPLGCGIMLDVCTVSLFPQGSFNTRSDFLLYAPLTSAFYHWVIGTMFMYQFAVLLASFRTCLRSGALWFIKDPQDQNFHPIREILERPTLVHIKKLILSGIMYATVVACSVATISGVLRIFSRTIMPFRLKVREPLSVVPVDLLFLHLVLPYTLQYFKPRKFLRQIGLRIWKFLARRLRLSSYLFGGRHIEEEITFKRRWYAPWGKVVGVEVDGKFRRVPNSDNVALVKNEPATAEVDGSGQPVDERAAQLMQLQNAEAEKARRNIKDDYVVVYLPPYFRYRIMAFTVALWTTCSAALASFVGLPVLLGRYFFKLFVPYQVHDGYSFLAGFYLLWACWLVSNALDKMDKHRQRRGGDQPRADFALYLAKRTLLWSAQATYMAFCLGVLVPTLIALVIELYIILPSRHAFHPDVRPRIKVVDMWALGLLYTKVGLRLQRIRPVGQIARGIDNIRRNGWTHLDPIAATKDVIGPLVVGLLGMVVLPPAILWGIFRAFRLDVDEHILFLHVYPSIFTLAAVIQGAIALQNMLSTWSQTVRDKEFLVDMRLQNFDPETDLKIEEQVETSTEALVENEEI